MDNFPSNGASLYECTVIHHRFSPAEHRFSYPLFMIAVDLDELPRLGAKPGLFSVDRPNVYSLQTRGYLPTHEGDFARAPLTLSLRQRVEAYAADYGVDLQGCTIRLLTLPSVLGYVFNPVSFYFCTDREGNAVATIVEVTNTFREIKPYFLGPKERTEQEHFHRRTPKHFYVSPFSDVDVAFDFRLSVPAAKLSIQIDDYTGELRTLATSLTGSRRPFSSRRLAWYLLKYPLLSLMVMLRIHWQAFHLYRKRLPWFRKAARAEDQRDLMRPHSSILPAKP